MLSRTYSSLIRRPSFIFIILVCCLSIEGPSATSLAVPAKRRSTHVTPPNSPAAAAYLNKLRQSLLKNWELIDGKNTVVLEGIVSLDGSISELRSTSTAETNPLAVESAMNDVERCKPLPALPSCFKQSCKLTLTFHSNVDPHGDSDSNLTTEIAEIQNSQPATNMK